MLFKLILILVICLVSGLFDLNIFFFGVVFVVVVMYISSVVVVNIFVMFFMFSYFLFGVNVDCIFVIFMLVSV